MFTNNYRTYRRMMFLNKDSTFVNANGESVTGYAKNGYVGDIGYYLHMGQIDAPTNKSSTSSSTPNPSGCKAGVHFGSGSTPATKEDYTLEKLITSGMTITSRTAVIETTEVEGSYTFSASFILTNTSDAEINVYEIGYYGAICKDGNTTYTYPVLMERTVLSEPVTIPVGGQKLISYKLTFNQTLNVD